MCLVHRLSIDIACMIHTDRCEVKIEQSFRFIGDALLDPWTIITSYVIVTSCVLNVAI